MRAEVNLVPRSHSVLHFPLAVGDLGTRLGQVSFVSTGPRHRQHDVTLPFLQTRNGVKMKNFCQVFNPHYFAIELREALHERVIEVMSFSLLDESLSPANHVRSPKL